MPIKWKQADFDYVSLAKPALKASVLGASVLDVHPFVSSVVFVSEPHASGL